MTKCSECPGVHNDTTQQTQHGCFMDWTLMLYIVFKYFSGIKIVLIIFAHVLRYLPEILDGKK